MGISDWTESGRAGFNAPLPAPISGRQGSLGGDSSAYSSIGQSSGQCFGTSRLFSSYSQSSSESPCTDSTDSSKAPHVALHLVSELLDDESIASLGDAASSPFCDDEPVSPTMSDHAFPK